MDDAPRSLTGMHDVLPPASARWWRLVERFAAHAERAGMGLVRTPVLEELAVFERLGAGTDVVTKEMYAFEDRDGTTIALRPESTAGVARSLIQHHPNLPWRVWYLSEHFRHERPQAGRYRQHHQLGAECFGSPDPDIDVELVVLLWDFFADLGLRDVRLLVNSIGDAEWRARYVADLQAFLRTRLDDLDPLDRPKVEEHPLRVLDSKHAATMAALAGVPTMVERLEGPALAHHERVLAGLAAAGVDARVEPRLVRGLDYYTHTVFEIVSDALDTAQSTIGGGGRYDGLVAALGGDTVPGVGFGAGVERILLACDAEGVFDELDSVPDVFVVAFGGDGSDLRDLCTELRRAGLRAERAYDGRSGRAQIKAADRSGARLALIVGDDERAAGTVTIRDLRADSPQTAVPRTDLVNEIRRRLP